MTRRGPFEGSIYQRGDGLWVGVVHLGYDVGKRRRKYLYGKTRREVQERLTKTLSDRQKGLPVTSERLTVGQYLERWLQDVARPGLRPLTFRGYERIVRVHLLPTLGHIRLAKLTPQDVQALLNARQAAGKAPRTVQSIRAVLRRALGQAVQWGLVHRNVAALVNSPHISRPDIRPLTLAQVRTLLDAARGDRLEALYTVALAIGLRQGEALGLQWDDVDVKQGTLTVRHTLQRIDGKLTPVEPKTARSRRTIPLPAIAVTALRAHHARQLEERLRVGNSWTDSGYVFTTAVGTPLDAATVTRAFQRLLRRAGLPHQRFHDLRHACASLLLEQGVHPRVVQETLGHSQIGITMDTYSHVVQSLQREAADRMDVALAGAAGHSV